MLLSNIYNFVSLDHPWIKDGGAASDKPIDSAVLSRMKQFRAMNKLKKLALKVSLNYSGVPSSFTKSAIIW